MEARPSGRAALPETPTASEVYDRLREEWHALGMLSYHGGVPDGIWWADLTESDIARIRMLLRDAAATIEAYS